MNSFMALSILNPGKLVKIIKVMAKIEGCEAVILGRTELPLVVGNAVSPIPSVGFNTHSS